VKLHMPVHVTTDAIERVQAKVYPRHKSKNASHHKRMNAKWLRRYGVVGRPASFLVELPASPLGAEKLLVVHPTIWVTFQAELKARGIEPRFPFGAPF
jgi:hypothetical protein